MPNSSPATFYNMDHAASQWTSYRVPRYPSNGSPVDAQQNSKSGIDAMPHNLPEPFCNTDHDPRYRYPVVDSQWNDGAEPDAISENPLEPSPNIDHAASRWSSCRTPEHPSKWPSDWCLVNTRQNGSLQIPVNVEEEQPAQPKCTACWTELDESTTSMSCGHYWCSSCIVRRFTKIRNQTEWPVRCHHTSCVISLDTAKPFLRDEDIQRLTSLIEEFETAVMDRVYCSNTKCSTFIPRKDTENRIAHCGVCQTNTCSDCKGAAHESDGCPLPDQIEQKILIKSHKEKWQRCTRCGQMCERISGCSRIECLCGYNFCYHCAGPIYSCNGCPELEYGSRLTDRAARKQRRKAQRAPKQRTDFKKEFVAFTTRRARARTEGGVAPASETPYQQRQRLEDENFAAMMTRIHQRMDAERAQTERNLPQRARREQPSSIVQRIGHKIQRLCGRVFGL